MMNAVCKLWAFVHAVLKALQSCRTMDLLQDRLEGDTPVPMVHYWLESAAHCLSSH